LLLQARLKKVAMAQPKSTDQTQRLRRTIVLGTICVCASGLGLILARPIAAQFRMSSPWILPAIAVGILTILVVIALIVLPKITSRRA
jgi:Mg2+/Co2+ transporter CorB